MSSAELKQLIVASRAGRTPYVDTIVIAEDVQLVLPTGTPNHYGNHSCDPNLWWVDAYSLAARRDIRIGEELTHDYATSTGDERFELNCACGTRLCRGVVRGSDWKRRDLQARYEEHWVPALIERMKKCQKPASDTGG